jgi:hypothetical protein
MVLAMPDPQGGRMLDPACRPERLAGGRGAWKPVLAVAGRLGHAQAGTLTSTLLRGRTLTCLG